MFGMEYRPKCVLVSVMCFVLMLSLSLGFCFVAEFSTGVVRLFNVHGVAVLFLFWFSGVCSLAPVVGFGIKCDLIYPKKKEPNAEIQENTCKSLISSSVSERSMDRYAIL